MNHLYLLSLVFAYSDILLDTMADIPEIRRRVHTRFFTCVVIPRSPKRIKQDRIILLIAVFLPKKDACAEEKNAHCQ